MKFKNKNILIISQQDWGTMFISKHHYASELAKMGNTVYYLNGPDQENSLKMGEILIEEISKNLFIIRHRLYFPFNIKFHFKWLYNMLMKLHIKMMVTKIGNNIDVIWSFDISDTIPFDYFVKTDTVKILMPVDLNIHPDIIRRSVKADFIFSVSQIILDKFQFSPGHKYFINHGVNGVFLQDSLKDTNNNPLRVGMSGNFLIPALDRQTLVEIFKNNEEIIFELWGNTVSSNISSAEDSTQETSVFLDAIQNLENVIVHGIVPTNELATGLKRMDAFLIAYQDVAGTEKAVTNSHKILEYLGAGKVIVSNFISTYKDRQDLIVMVSENGPDNLKLLFEKVIKNLADYNKPHQQQTRIDFAREHLYSKQIEKIGGYISRN